MSNKCKDRFLVCVKVGPKGQITVPKEARDMFNINVGDTLVILGDVLQGMAVIKSDKVYDTVEEMKNGRSTKN